MFKLKFLYNFLSKLSKRERIFFYVTVFFVMFAALARVVVYPIIAKMEILDVRVEKKKIAIARDLRILTQEKRIEKESIRYNSYAGQFGSEEKEMSFFLKEISKLADKNSVYVIDLKPKGAKEQTGSKKYLITLSCEAQMEQIAKFMYDIESVNKLLSIETYQIGPKSKNSSLGVCNMIISKIIMF